MTKDEIKVLKMCITLELLQYFLVIVRNQMMMILMLTYKLFVFLSKLQEYGGLPTVEL